MAAALLVLTVALVVVQHLTRPDLPPAAHFVSEYAGGEAGWVMTVAFGTWAASLALTARAVGSRVAGGLLVLAAAGCVVCAAFETETVGGVLPEDRERTLGGGAHDLGSLAIFAGILLAALWTARRRPRVTAGLAAWLVAWPALLVIAGADAPGWGQRGFIAAGWAWEAVVLWQAGHQWRSRPASASRRTGPPQVPQLRRR
jgi:hypothetical protein